MSNAKTIAEAASLLEARAVRAETTVIQLRAEMDAFYRRRSGALNDFYRVETRYDQWGPARALVLRIMPKSSQMMMTDETLCDVGTTLCHATKYIDELVDMHSKHLRGALDTAIFEAARFARNDPRANAYR